MSQEKWRTMLMQKSWGVIEVYYGIVQVVNSNSEDVTGSHRRNCLLSFLTHCSLPDC